jgi:hypothetical protein
MGAVSRYLFVCESWEVSPRPGANEWIAARKRMKGHSPTCASLDYDCTPVNVDLCNCATGAQEEER